METDSKNRAKTIHDLEIEILKQRSYIVSDDSDVLQSAWLRRTIQASNGLDRFLLDYGFDFLLRCAFFSWTIFLVEKIF